MKIKVRFEIAGDEDMPVKEGDRYPSISFDDIYEQTIDLTSREHAMARCRAVITAFNSFTIPDPGGQQ